MASERILLVGSIVRGEIDWRLAPLAPVTDADLDALIDEVYGKPGLSVEDSAGLFDVDPVGDAYALGQADNAAGRYAPPAGNAEHDAYIRGHNDAWAAAKSVSWWRRGSER